MKILVVEDNQKLADSLKKGLEQEGYTVDCLHEGDAAQRRLWAQPDSYDLVVLDIMLPGMSGLQVCEQARTDNITVPIIMLTAKDTVADRIVGLDAGADDYLIKPFAFEELLARVRALLRRPKQSAPEILSVRGIVLDSGSKSVAVDGKQIALTLREYAILEYLLRNPNQIVSREKILAHVWEHSFDLMSNVVDVHIKNLRKKLGSHGKQLETRRGMGYRLKI